MLPYTHLSILAYMYFHLSILAYIHTLISPYFDTSIHATPTCTPTKMPHPPTRLPQRHHHTHFLKHLGVNDSRLQAVMEMGVSLDLEGESPKLRLVHKRMFIGQSLVPTLPRE